MSQSYDLPSKTELTERIIEAFEEQLGVDELDDDMFSLACLAADEAFEYYRQYDMEGLDDEPEVD